MRTIPACARSTNTLQDCGKNSNENRRGHHISEPSAALVTSSRPSTLQARDGRSRSRTSSLALEMPMPEHNRTGNFEQEALPHLDAAYNLARGLTRNEQDAEDVVQEAYLRAFRFFSGFRGGDARAWLMRIVRNTCYTWLHVNRPLQGATEFDDNILPADSSAPNPEEVVFQNEDGALVRRALEKLPVNYREVLILHELEGMSYREIADITGMPAGTVMSSLSRARGRLRQILTGLMSGDSVASSRRIAAANA